MTNDQEPGTVAEAPGEIHFTSFQGKFEMFKKCKKGSLPSGLLFVGLLTLAIPQMANAAVIFFEDFSDNSAGWTLGSSWAIGSANSSSGQNYGGPDPASDHTPTTDNGIAGVVIGGNAPTSLHDFYYLISPVIDTSNFVGSLSFEYYRWLNSDYTPYMQNRVDVFNGSSWTNLFITGVSPGVQDSSWTQQLFNITPYANPNLQIRMGYSIGSSGVFTVSSWNVDDVVVFDNANSVPEPASLALLGIGLAGLGFTRRRKRA